MISVSACNHFSKKTSEIRFDVIQPEPSDNKCMSDELVNKLLKHNCKLEPDNESCE